MQLSGNYARSPARVALLALLALAALSRPALARADTAQCRREAATAASLQQLRVALARGRFVAYEPTALRVIDGRAGSADADSIRADLTVLRRHFDSLVTYDAVHGAQQIPAIAAALGFRALIIGVWNPLDPAQLTAATAAARRFPHLVVGLSLGNETLFFQRATPAALIEAMGKVRGELPWLPLSTTEPFHLFSPAAAAAALLPHLDFLLVNVHPLFQPWFHSAPQETAVRFVGNVSGDLARSYCGPILIKETGEPSGPAAAGFTPERQASFYRLLRVALPASPQRAFAYFSAFDAPWRAQEASAAARPEEAFWGLYDSQRQAKPAARELPALTSPPARP